MASEDHHDRPANRQSDHQFPKNYAGEIGESSEVCHNPVFAPPEKKPQQISSTTHQETRIIKATFAPQKSRDPSFAGLAAAGPSDVSRCTWPRLLPRERSSERSRHASTSRARREVGLGPTKHVAPASTHSSPVKRSLRPGTSTFQRLAKLHAFAVAEIAETSVSGDLCCGC